MESCPVFVNQVGNMDPIANMLVSIRNAQAVQKESVVIPYSQVKHTIADLLMKEGFVDTVKKQQHKNSHPSLLIGLKYRENGAGVIVSARRVSTPGRRMYVKNAHITPVKGGNGVSIISTSKGIMTEKKAKKEGLGGEVLCEVW